MTGCGVYQSNSDNTSGSIKNYRRRSDEAANILNELGYINIYDFGGIIDWNYDIEK